MSLRELARQLDVTPSYVSDIENDRRVPSEQVLRAISKILELPFDDLMAAAGRFGDNAERYLRRVPAAGLLFRRISDAQFKDDEVRKLIDAADKLSNRRRPRKEP